MSLKSAFKSFLFEEEAPKAPQVEEAAAPKAPIVSNTSSSAPPVPQASVAEIAAIDQGLQAILLDAINGSGAAAYQALDTVVESLEDVVPDVNVRYKKALQILTKQGHSPITIINDVDKVIGALEESSRQFEADQKKQFQTSVGALHRSVETLG